MTSFNSEKSLNQINAELVQEMTDEQASTVAGSGEGSTVDIEDFPFDIGGDAVIDNQGYYGVIRSTFRF